MACHGSQSAFQRSRRRLLAGATNHPVAGATNAPLEPLGTLDLPGQNIYPPANIQKTMENHHFLWANPLQMAIFNSYFDMFEPGNISKEKHL